MNKYFNFLTTLLFIFLGQDLDAQNTIRGEVFDAINNDPIIGASVIIQGTTIGTVSDWDGSFEFETENEFPLTLEISYIGYTTQITTLNSNKRISINLQEDVEIIDVIEVTATRISDKQKESPLTVEALDIIAIKETPASNFYDGLGSLKGVDLTAASLGFKIVNTRGFNSTSPVRSLQIIDGVDNQAPGLSFSLGNFLGSSELDINKVELIVGASSAFYGPNAFNGVISMETKDPFFTEGFSALINVGERNMIKPAVRWAQKIQNKNGDDLFAYKLNFEYLRADDWEADNRAPVDESRVPASNPGRFDAVNTYGDEYFSGNDFRDQPISSTLNLLGAFYRTGYEEEDLFDYDTRNLKASANFHLRTNPSKGVESPELILANSFGSGTTVYQGDNRFSLNNINFLQNRLEFKKRNKFFIRAYSTQTSAGDSFDPFFTALQLQENAKDNIEWSQDYTFFWVNVIGPLIAESGFPQIEVLTDDNGNPIFNDDGSVQTFFDNEAYDQWLIDNAGSVAEYHAQAQIYADTVTRGASAAVPFFEPGTERFQQEFDRISTSLRADGGTKFFDRSALYHLHGEYTFNPLWIDEIKVGGNYRLYTPDSRGTIFVDTADIRITNSEFGFYSGAEKSFYNNKLKASATIRVDKNENYDYLVSPAASLVYTPSPNNFFRASFSSAIRNPTLSDQFLLLDVGRATLAGNLNGVEDLVTVESVTDFFRTLQASELDTFSIDPIRPEEVKTFELGFRTTLFDKLYVDAGYYYSFYTNFIGFEIGVDLDFTNVGGGTTIQSIEAFRYASNAKTQVTTQGFSIGFNYYLDGNFGLNGNYSWNRLNLQEEDDPIIPAFNTPEHKFNIGFGGRDLSVNLGQRRLNNLAFNINYKWIEGFLFEGSPQFTGFIPSYDLLDAQFNVGFPKLNSTIKIGASNVLNSQNFQTFGGPRIGRLAYITWTYEPK